MATIVIEQTNDYPQRMKYEPETDSFHETGYSSLAYARGVTFPYGWLKESGTPPTEDYLDQLVWKINNRLIQISQENQQLVFGALVIAVIEKDRATITSLGDASAFFFGGVYGRALEPGLHGSI